MTKAQYLLQKKLIASGLMEEEYWYVYDIGVGYTQDDRNKESVQLLKKITDMVIDGFSSHIIEEIKNTWENWNSPRLSIDSLHLDEIEEMNLDNIHER
ncbi:hypothetical protein Goklo_028214 [Gossypium klotzschianum]|uniref:Uncharacterized protein n=1 Tax=Gossypium klotzschianum TaxID=34286 RepID=A0A7J8U0N6_9ROSI|nr:hypothetical protein [Gossypium klotzschianum]